MVFVGFSTFFVVLLLCVIDFSMIFSDSLLDYLPLMVFIDARLEVLDSSAALSFARPGSQMPTPEPLRTCSKMAVRVAFGRLLASHHLLFKAIVALELDVYIYIRYCTDNVYHV